LTYLNAVLDSHSKLDDNLTEFIFTLFKKNSSKFLGYEGEHDCIVFI